MPQRPLEPGQHLSIRHTERLIDAGIEPSAAGIGDSCDALVGTLSGLSGAGPFHHESPRRGLEHVELETLRRVRWFNHERFLEPIVWVSPAAFKEAYHRNRTRAGVA